MAAGSVISSVILADIDTTESVGCAFTGIVGTQRVRVLFSHNKTEYNQAIFDDNASGDFDSNLAFTSFYLTDSPPVSNVPFPTAAQSPINLSNNLLSNSPTEIKNYATFRAEEIWANLNQSKYVTIVYKFTYIDSNNNQQTDFVRKTVSFTFRKFDDGTNIELNAINDADGNPITDYICDSYGGLVYPDFTSLLPNQYTQIVTYTGQSNNVSEQNDHNTNTQLSQLSANLVSDLTPVSPINNNDTFQFCVDTSLLENDIEYCFNTILIQETPIPSGVDCPCISLTLDQVITNQNTQQYAFDTVFTLGGITAPDIQNIDVIYPNGTITGLSNFNNTITGTLNLILPIGLLTISKYIVNVTSANGCYYNFNVNLPTETISLAENNCSAMLCDLVAPSPTAGDGSFVFVEIDGNVDCSLLAPSGTVLDLFNCMTTVLNNLGYTYSNIIINSANGTNIDAVTLITIEGTDLAAADFNVFYEDYGDATITQDCSQGAPTTWVVDDSANLSVNSVLNLQLADGTIAVNGPWLLQLAGQQAQMEADIQNWIDTNSYGGTVTITNPSPLPRVRVEIINTIAPLAGAQMQGLTTPYFIEQP